MVAVNLLPHRFNDRVESYARDQQKRWGRSLSKGMATRATRWCDSCKGHKWSISGPGRRMRRLYRSVMGRLRCGIDMLPEVGHRPLSDHSGVRDEGDGIGRRVAPTDVLLVALPPTRRILQYVLTNTIQGGFSTNHLFIVIGLPYRSAGRAAKLVNTFGYGRFV